MLWLARTHICTSLSQHCNFKCFLFSKEIKIAVEIERTRNSSGTAVLQSSHKTSLGNRSNRPGVLAPFYSRSRGESSYARGVLTDSSSQSSKHLFVFVSFCFIFFSVEMWKRFLFIERCKIKGRFTSSKLDCILNSRLFSLTTQEARCDR